MPSSEYCFGTFDVIASARIRVEQPIRVRGLTAVASPTGGAHLAVRVGGVLVYLEDRAALEALRRAIREADALADDVFGPDAS
jgi:hypothetical protein